MILGEEMPNTKTILSKKRFLERFKKYYMVGTAAKAAGIDRTTVYKWLKKDKTFEGKFRQTRNEMLTVLEDEAFRRAYKGVAEPVFYKGEECGIVQKFSDRLLIVLLKAYAPEKYREHIEQKQSGEVVLKVKYDDAPGDTGQTETPA
jgi:hypothetical protein